MKQHKRNCFKVRWGIFSFFSSTNVEMKNVRPIAYNVLRLVAEMDLESQCFNLALLPIRSTNVRCSTNTLFATNRCYVLGGLSALNLI